MFSYLLYPNSKDKHSLSGKKLFSVTFRCTEKNKKSFIFFGKSLIRCVFSGKISMKEACHVYNSGKTFFYDNDFSMKKENERISHIEYFLEKRISGSVWKDLLLGYFTIGDKIIQIFFEIVLFLFLFPVSLFVKYKGSVGFILCEYIELVNLVKIVKKNKIDTLYYYSIYEKDSNISSIALQNEGVRVVKITSLTPLKFWNHTIVAVDELILCDMNQLEELSTFKDTIQATNVKVWGPETIANSAKHYLNQNKYDLNKNVIGFYSTAVYLREYQGNIKQNFGGNENIVKQYLAEYIKNHVGTKLIIFPHPREKKKVFKDRVNEHYKAFFEGIDYCIYNSLSPSAECFEMVDLGVAMYSSVIYERLYFGFKSIMMPFGELGLELPGETLSHICAKNKLDFFRKMDVFMKLSVSEYFEETGIRKSPFMIKILNKTGKE